MQAVLDQLGIRQNNHGASTGSNWIESKGNTMQSISPVDGKLIAEVSRCTEAAYEEVMRTASKAFGD